MKVMLDSTCPRCGWTSSSTGLDIAIVRALPHICADGFVRQNGEPKERIVYGPGERLKDKEEM